MNNKIVISEQIERGLNILRSLTDLEEEDETKTFAYRLKIFEDQKFYDEKELNRLEAKVLNWKLETETFLTSLGIEIDVNDNPFQSQSPLSSIDKRGALVYDIRNVLNYLSSLNKKSKTMEQPTLNTKQLLLQIDQLKEEVGQLTREKAVLEKANLELQKKATSNVSNIIIVEDRKIDVIKILHAMSKIGLFKMKDGSKFTIKVVMEFFGNILNNNFTKYSTNLSTSKSKTKELSYMQVFDDLRKAANDYLKKS